MKMRKKKKMKEVRLRAGKKVKFLNFFLLVTSKFLTKFGRSTSILRTTLLNKPLLIKELPIYATERSSCYSKLNNIDDLQILETRVEPWDGTYHFK